MGENSSIQWTDHTFNPWIGCTKVSPGCANCYAESETFPRVQRANGRELWGKGKPRHRTSEANWRKSLQWNKAPNCWSETDCGRARVFCASMSDWLDDEVPIEWLRDLLELIRLTPNLDWLLLTKRPKNWRERVASVAILDNPNTDLVTHAAGFATRALARKWVEDGTPPANVWFGVSVEDQKRADERIPELLKIPARIRFLSVEPLLGPVDFDGSKGSHDGRGLCWDWTGKPVHVPHCDYRAVGKEPPTGSRIHWAIFGGESVGGRPCNIEWILDGVNQCQDAGVKVFVKQLGSNPVDGSRMSLDADRIPLRLKDHKGGDISEWPAELRVREFPTVETP